MAYSQEVIQQTREHFADIYRRCIEDARNGTSKPNDLPSYIKWREDAIEDTMAGRYDHSVTFRQMMHYFATGECLALLP